MLRPAPFLSFGHPTPDGGRNINAYYTNTCPLRGKVASKRRKGAYKADESNKLCCLFSCRNNSHVKKFAKMIADHRVGILNYFHIPVTIGPVVGINNKNKVLKRKAYGYRNVDYFKLRVYFLHESRYALIG